MSNFIPPNPEGCESCGKIRTKFFNCNGAKLCAECSKKWQEGEYKRAQKHKCLFCDEYEVIWDGKQWACLACGNINDYS